MAITYNTPISELGMTSAAPKILTEAGITTVGQLLDCKRATITGLSGLGTNRINDIERALNKHGLWIGRPLPDFGAYLTCNACLPCGTCGMPRASQAKHVVINLRGRAKHVTAPGDPCDGCDTHHRELIAAAAAA